MSDDLAPIYPPREIRLIWEQGEPLTVELEGDFDTWEVKAALNEALDECTRTSEDEDEDADRG